MPTGGRFDGTARSMAVGSVKYVSYFAVFVAVVSVGLVYFEPQLKENPPKVLLPAIKAIYRVLTALRRWLRRDEYLHLAEGVFSPYELRKYDGTSGSKGLYLAVLGRVYDVKKGAQHYKPGGGYAHFAGRDASRAYITGDYNEDGLTDDLSGIDDDSLLSFKEWVDFYESEYRFVGKLAGRYYTNEGRQTDELKRVLAAIERAKEKKLRERESEKTFPPCNSEWTQNTGTVVWCSKKSGGISRHWAGVPRQYFQPGKSQPKCVCVRNDGPPSDHPTASSHSNRGDLDHPHLREYPNCRPFSDTCKLDS